MVRIITLSLVLLAARVTYAANLGAFAQIAAPLTWLVALLYLAGAAGIVYFGAHAILALRDRQYDGLGSFFWHLALTVVSALFMFVLIPEVIAPGLALGATIR